MISSRFILENSNTHIVWVSMLSLYLKTAIRGGIGGEYSARRLSVLLSDSYSSRFSVRQSSLHNKPDDNTYIELIPTPLFVTILLSMVHCLVALLSFRGSVFSPRSEGNHGK